MTLDKKMLPLHTIVLPDVIGVPGVFDLFGLDCLSQPLKSWRDLMLLVTFKNEYLVS